MQNVGTNELIGLFESIYENESKIQAHKETCKEIKRETDLSIKEFSKEKEVSEKNIKNAYKYYKECVIDGESGSDDYFTLCALVDTLDNGNDNTQG